MREMIGWGCEYDCAQQRLLMHANLFETFCRTYLMMTVSCKEPMHGVCMILGSSCIVK